MTTKCDSVKCLQLIFDIARILIYKVRKNVNAVVCLQGAAEAGDRAASLDVFKDSQTVKINPDKPQEQCRFKTLEVSAYMY